MESWTSSGISVCGALRQCLGKSWSMFPCLDRSVIVWECHVWGFLALKPRDSNPGSWVPWFWGSTWIHFCWPKLAGEESAVAGSQCQQQGWKDCFADGFPSFSNQFSSSLPSSIKHFPIFPTNQPFSSFSIQSSIQWSSSTDHVPILSIYFSSSLPSSANHFPYFPSKSSHFTTTNQPSLTPQCASRHSRVHFFDGLVAKSAPNLKRF